MTSFLSTKSSTSTECWKLTRAESRASNWQLAKCCSILRLIRLNLSCCNQTPQSKVFNKPWTSWKQSWMGMSLFPICKRRLKWQKVSWINITIKLSRLKKLLKIWKSKRLRFSKISIGIHTICMLSLCTTEVQSLATTTASFMIGSAIFGGGSTTTESQLKKRK